MGRSALSVRPAAFECARGPARLGRDLSRQKLHAALAASRLRIAGMDVNFTGGGHTGSRFVELVQVTRDGRFVR